MLAVLKCLSVQHQCKQVPRFAPFIHCEGVSSLLTSAALSGSRRAAMRPGQVWSHCTDWLSSRSTKTKHGCVFFPGQWLEGTAFTRYISCSTNYRQMFESPGWSGLERRSSVGTRSKTLSINIFRRIFTWILNCLRIDTNTLATCFKDHRGHELLFCLLFHNGIYQVPD